VACIHVAWNRWHEHDADEIQEHADKCIEQAIVELAKAGWAKESIKVVGTPFSAVIYMIFRFARLILSS
jgi:hypothetical protein